jgi:protein phosphatase
MTLAVIPAARTDVGQVRARNEDAFALAKDGCLAVVADGMGGPPAGDLASSLAVETVVSFFEASPPPGSGEGREARVAHMDDAMQEAHQRIQTEARGNSENEGMGCTLTILHVDPSDGAFLIGHVGDSRAYRMSHGSLVQLTTDQTLVQEQVDRGIISADAARHHPLGHILTQAVGSEGEIVPEMITGIAEAGDLLLLCSDGLVRVMDNGELGEWVERLEGGNLDELAESLIVESNARGAPDNVTVAVLRVVTDP